MTKNHGVQIDAVLIDQAQFGQALRQVWTGDLNLAVMGGLERADRLRQIALKEHGVRAD